MKGVPANEGGVEDVSAGKAAALQQMAALDVVAEAIRKRHARLIREVAEIDQNGDVIWDERLCVYGAMQAYVTLLWLAEHGDKDAAKTLFQSGVGLPEQPYLVKVQNLTVEETIRELYLEHRRQGMTDEKARAYIKEATGAEVPALPEWAGEEKVE